MIAIGKTVKVSATIARGRWVAEPEDQVQDPKVLIGKVGTVVASDPSRTQVSLVQIDREDYWLEREWFVIQNQPLRTVEVHPGGFTVR